MRMMQPPPKAITDDIQPLLTYLSPCSLRMMDDSDIESYCGIPSEREGGFFDPFGLSKNKDEETLRWYRAAELKHGRISMLATLGIVIQGFNTKIIPGFPVTETNEIEALKKVYYEAPEALVQVSIKHAITFPIFLNCKQTGSHHHSL